MHLRKWLSLTSFLHYILQHQENNKTIKIAFGSKFYNTELGTSRLMVFFTIDEIFQVFICIVQKLIENETKANHLQTNYQTYLIFEYISQKSYLYYRIPSIFRCPAYLRASLGTTFTL